MEKIGDTLAHFPRPRRVSLAGAEEAAASPACPICKDFGFVRHDVTVEHADFGRAFPCVCRRTEVEDRLRRRSNLGPLGARTFDTFDPEGPRDATPRTRVQLRAAFQGCRDYADDLRPPWLVLVGPSGCGKTHLAAAIANHRVSLGEPAFFTVVPDLLDHLRATYAPGTDVTYDELFESVRNAPLLVLDDLGTQSASPWAQEKLFQILNHRFNAALPTVITTNHPLTELEERLRARLEGQLAVRVDVREWDTPILESLLRDWPDGLAAQHFETFQIGFTGLSAAQNESLKLAHQAAADFAVDPHGWLVLVGDIGRGKTHLAAAIKNYRDEHGEPTLFMTVPDLLDYLRATYAPTSDVTYDRGFDVIRNAPALILDDYGAHSSTQWAEEKLFQLLNHRFNARLATVITTNLAVDRADALASVPHHEARIFSRLLTHGFSRVVRIDSLRFGRVPARRDARAPQDNAVRGRPSR